MGNSIAVSTCSSLKIAAMAKYMKLTKVQVMILRNSLAHTAKTHKATVSRTTFLKAAREAQISDVPDLDILGHLFTMWDRKGIDRVPVNEFVFSISLFACKDDSAPASLRFALQVADKNKKGVISPEEARAFVRSISATASYLGDKLLTLRQCYKVVDNVFETTTLISTELDTLTHELFVKALCAEPTIRQLVFVDSPQQSSLQTRRAIVTPKAAAGGTRMDLLEKFKRQMHLGPPASNSLMSDSTSSSDREQSVESEYRDESEDQFSMDQSLDQSYGTSDIKLTPLTRQISINTYN